MLNEPEQKEKIKPVLELREGNTTFLIGLHFSENTRETLGDKIKKLIRKDVQDGNF
ncbi:MAG: transposon-encoded TnpW family protein [Oscillospiraceae bacterium]|nr:transposon-encoded TnpW family protein [Oscillospiraceae bacterium]